MKIYFEDGILRDSSQLPFTCYTLVNAACGVSRNISVLDELVESEPDAIVYTNSIFAFSNEYAWNEEMKVPEIYIRSGEQSEFVRIDKLTTRELRFAHNLAKMYVAGAFEQIKE